MAALNNEILKDIFFQIGKLPPPSSFKSRERFKPNDEALIKFILSGKQQLKTALNFFAKTSAALVSDNFIEVINDKGESIGFGKKILSIICISNLFQKNITKLESQKFHPDFLPFWDAVKLNIKELILTDVWLSKTQSLEAIRSLKNIEKAVVQMGIYSLTILQEIPLPCRELLLKVIPFDHIENSDFHSTNLPTVKKLTIIGHYETYGIQNMSLKKLLKKLKRAFPNVLNLCLIINEDNIENESAKEICDLVFTPRIDPELDLKIIFNFITKKSNWKCSYFYSTLKILAGIEFPDPSNHSKSHLKISDKRLIEINLSSQTEEENSNDDDDEEDDFEPPPTKRKRI